ncbi:hypothetical protein [Ureaplasma canigenitalium]|uniref:hypothetical protein n=1 Tax=Ureaplasma canigenitalium TaxID=42092 RepID=UPI0004E0B1BF|nr:hypothetical protein [Ureaplasma canigenitalium]
MQPQTKYNPYLSQLEELKELGNKALRLKRRVSELYYDNSSFDDDCDRLNQSHVENVVEHYPLDLVVEIDSSNVSGNRVVEKIVEVEKPVYVEKVVEVEKIVEKPIEVEKIVEKKVETIIETEKEMKPKKAKNLETVKYRKLKNTTMSDAGWKIFNLVKDTLLNKESAIENFEQNKEKK